MKTGKVCVLICAILAASIALSADEDLSAVLPRLKPLSPEESLKAFRVEEGFEIQLVAAEPAVTDPVAIAWDEAGRLYVCELWNYPGHPKPKEPLGRIRLLESTRGDGVYDKSTIFAEDVLWPSGILPWDGGVFVISSPDIWYFKDTAGSGKADVRKRVLSGFHGKTYEVANCLQWNLDNRIYVCGSYAGGSVRPVDKPDVTPVNARDFRFDPLTVLNGTGVEAVSGGGEWGNTFDDWGNRFTCDATNLAYHAILPRDELAHNPYLAVAQVQENCAGQWAKVFPISAPEPWKSVRQNMWSRWKNTTSDMRASRFPSNELAPQGFATSAAGLSVYRGSAFPPRYQGSAFIGEPANNVVVRLELKADGVGFKALRPDAQNRKEFLASTDNWFRPVNFANGPDGCLYVVSMYREVIEDDGAIPADILKHLDLYSGRERGRIYRIVPSGFKIPPFASLARAGTAELVKSLSSPDAWQRETAQCLLYQRQDKTASESLRELARVGSPVSKVHALWTLHGLGELKEQDLLKALGDADEHVREHALRLAESALPGTEPLRQRIVSAARDAAPRVRMQAAFALGRISGGGSLDALAAIAGSDASDKWIRAAIASAVPERAGQLFEALMNRNGFLQQTGAPELLSQLIQIAGARTDAEEIHELLTALTGRRFLDQRVLQRKLLADLAAGLSKGGGSIAAIVSGENAAALRQAMDAFFDDARRTALDDTKAVTERTGAIQLLAYASFEKVAEPLLSLLHPAQPPELQKEAIRAMAAHADAAVATEWIRHWRDSAPAVRQEILDGLFRRAEWLPFLLDAIDSKKVPVSEIPLERRNALLKHADPKISARAAIVLPAQSQGTRQDLIVRYQKQIAGLAGDSERGARLFKDTCAACHSPPQGERAGPNLATLEDRSGYTLLVAILDPNRDVKPSFISFNIVTQDGLTLTGAIASESAASITLRSSGGKEETILRKNIKRLVSSGISLMPEGLEAAIDPQQMADLLRYLGELK